MSRSGDDVLVLAVCCNFVLDCFVASFSPKLSVAVAVFQLRFQWKTVANMTFQRCVPNKGCVCFGCKTGLPILFSANNLAPARLAVPARQRRHSTVSQHVQCQFPSKEMLACQCAFKLCSRCHGSFASMEKTWKSCGVMSTTDKMIRVRVVAWCCQKELSLKHTLGSSNGVGTLWLSKGRTLGSTLADKKN